MPLIYYYIYYYYYYSCFSFFTPQCKSLFKCSTPFTKSAHRTLFLHTRMHGIFRFFFFFSLPFCLISCHRYSLPFLVLFFCCCACFFVLEMLLPPTLCFGFMYSPLVDGILHWTNFSSGPAKMRWVVLSTSRPKNK